jgi:Zn ribbon nucleic-acid-binding protein
MDNWIRRGTLPMTRNGATCPLCSRAERSAFKEIDGFTYYECSDCDFIFIDADVMARIDAGEQLRTYDTQYWESELSAARERAWGPALARVAEVILYCRIPIKRFIDIGTGPGYILDSLSWALPSSRSLFYGIELFPPDPRHRTTHPNYKTGSLASFVRPFQCGSCIEVVEHLTPKMLSRMAQELGRVSSRGACYIFNTGLTTYVKREDEAYVDPLRRGHISIWSYSALRIIFEPYGFKVYSIPGKTWAVIVEYKPKNSANVSSVVDRIWTPCSENRKILEDSQTGTLMYILGIDTARAYLV